MTEATKSVAKAKFAACDTCPGKDATYVPSSFPDKKVRLAIVGEAPGWQEQKEGKPFVGASGQMLERIYSRAGINRSEIFFSNAVLCNIKNKDDLDAARKCCAKRLTEELRASGAS